MSYDITFYTPKSKTRSAKDYKAFFETRENYSIDNDYYNYENEHTGAYFYFHYIPPSEEDTDEGREIPEAVKLGHLYFNINFCRPSFFAHEAAEEIAALCDALGLWVDNPQDDEGIAPINKEAIISTYTSSNTWATKTMASMGAAGESYYLDASKMIEFWQYLYSREYIQEDVIGEDTFFPSLFLGLHHQQPTQAQRWYMFQSNLETTIPANAEYAMVFDLSDSSNQILSMEGILVPHQELLDFLGLGPAQLKTARTKVDDQTVGYYNFDTTRRKELIEWVLNKGFESGADKLQRLHPSVSTDVEVAPKKS